MGGATVPYIQASGWCYSILVKLVGGATVYPSQASGWCYSILVKLVGGATVSYIGLNFSEMVSGTIIICHAPIDRPRP